MHLFWPRSDPGFGLWVFIGSFDELAGLEAGTGPDERDEVGRVHGAPAGLRGLDEFERHRQAAAREPGPRVIFRSGDVGGTDSSGRLAELLHLLPRQRVSKLVRSYERDRWQGS
jgi:hypothetical protein